MLENEWASSLSDVTELVDGVWTQLDEPSVLGETVEERRCVGEEGGRDVVLFDPPRIQNHHPANRTQTGDSVEKVSDL